MGDIFTALTLAENKLKSLQNRREELLVLIAETEVEIKGLQMAIERESVHNDGEAGG